MESVTSAASAMGRAIYGDSTNTERNPITGPDSRAQQGMTGQTSKISGAGNTTGGRDVIADNAGYDKYSSNPAASSMRHGADTGAHHTSIDFNDGNEYNSGLQKPHESISSAGEHNGKFTPIVGTGVGLGGKPSEFTEDISSNRTHHNPANTGLGTHDKSSTGLGAHDTSSTGLGTHDTSSTGLGTHNTSSTGTGSGAHDTSSHGTTGTGIGSGFGSSGPGAKLGGSARDTADIAGLGALKSHKSPDVPSESDALGSGVTGHSTATDFSRTDIDNNHHRAGYDSGNKHSSGSQAFAGTDTSRTGFDDASNHGTTGTSTSTGFGSSHAHETTGPDHSSGTILSSGTGVGTKDGDTFNESADLGSGLSGTHKSTHSPSSNLSGDVSSVDAPRGPTGTAMNISSGSGAASSKPSAPILDTNKDPHSSSNEPSTTHPGSSKFSTSNAAPSSTTGALGHGNDPATSVEPSVSAKTPHTPHPTSHSHIDIDSPPHGATPNRRKSIPLVTGEGPKGEMPDIPGTGGLHQSTGEGTGTKYEKSSGMAAEGGDFDAARPGAGREADRLLDEKGVHHGKDVGHNTHNANGAHDHGEHDGHHKPSVGQKIKEKLHIGKH